MACDFVNVYDYDTGHMSTERDPEIIYTSDFGAYCGGYIEVYYCPCGERAFVYTDNIGCDLHCSCEWYEDEEGKEDHYKDTYTCAVTDPEKCPFAFTFETWRGYDNMCRPTVYYVYTFGVGTDNPYVISYSVSGSTSHHNLWDKNIYSESDVIDGVPADISYNECRCVRCGYLESTRYIVSFSDEDGHCVSRVVTTETFVNGTLYSEEIMKYVYPYAEYNAGDYRYSNEFVVSREYNVYDESGNITYWSTSEYDYSEGYCKPNVTNRDSDGYEWSGSEGHRRDEYYVTINPSTCTQHGSQMSICHWCGEEFEITQYPHNHAYQWDYENAMYVCVYCGLNNEKGVDGNVILEDLTEEYGYGEYLVMGYLFRDCFDYIVAVSIVVDGIEEPIILENVFGYDDNSSIVRVNIGEVASAIAEMGYSIYDVNVRVSIVPFGGDSEFDYAITFDTVAAE